MRVSARSRVRKDLLAIIRGQAIAPELEMIEKHCEAVNTQTERVP